MVDLSTRQPVEKAETYRQAMNRRLALNAEGKSVGVWYVGEPGAFRALFDGNKHRGWNKIYLSEAETNS